MYYKSVNRGLSFTKPGVYSFGLVLVLGMVAVASGINGLFVFLSIGLGGFIISGLLSERAMKSCTITSVASTIADAHAPFEVTFTLENRSRWFTVYSMRGLFVLQAPRFRLIASSRSEVAGVRIARIAPRSTEAYRALSHGMPRGAYDHVLAMQLTTFPFGILEKFKLADVPASMLVAPAVDQQALETLRQMLKVQFQHEEASREFYGHRAYLPRDSLKDVNWKKSAGRRPSDWVVKLHRSPVDQLPLRIRAPLAEAARLSTDLEYERYFSCILTAVSALDELGRPWLLDLGTADVLKDARTVRKTLARLPEFAARAELAPYARSQAGAPRETVLAVAKDGFAWETGKGAASETAVP